MKSVEISELRIIMLLIYALHTRRYQGVVLHSYLKDGLGLLRVGIGLKTDPKGPQKMNQLLASFYVATFSSFEKSDRPSLKPDGVLLETELSTVVDSFESKFLKTLSKAENIENEKYVEWFDGLIGNSSPDGFYVVEDENIIYPKRDPEYYSYIGEVPRY